MHSTLQPMTRGQMIRLTAGRTVGSSVLACSVAYSLSHFFPDQDLTSALTLAIVVPFFVTPFLTWRTAVALRDMRAAQIEMATMARTDPLTGLANRRAFFDADSHVRERADPALRCALLFIDIDHFKQINDAHGHEGGDVVLRSLAARLGDNLRANEVVARFGGEEFVVAFYDLSIEDAIRIAERIGDAARNDRVAFRSAVIRYSVSIGVAFGAVKTPIDRMLSTADAQLYLAKNSGRDCVRWDGGALMKGDTRPPAAARRAVGYA